MISVVVPVYRAELTLNELYIRLIKAAEISGQDFEIIFVEDCGGDSSWEIIKKLANRDSRVLGFKLSRNFGQHNALLCGILKARGEIIITLDDDLQHPPETLSKLLVKLEHGYDLVYGVPERQQHGSIRNLASKITKILLEDSMGASGARNISALRVFKAKLKKPFIEHENSLVNIDVLLSWASNNVATVSVTHSNRQTGKSGYNSRKLISHAINMMTGFSTLPLKFASMTGFLCAFFGLVILMYVLASFLLQGRTVPGFAFLASIIILFSGTQLIALGIIGEYLARIYLRAIGRPPYIVNECTDEHKVLEN